MFLVNSLFKAFKLMVCFRDLVSSCEYPVMLPIRPTCHRLAVQKHGCSNVVLSREKLLALEVFALRKLLGKAALIVGTLQTVCI